MSAERTACYEASDRVIALSQIRATGGSGLKAEPLSHLVEALGLKRTGGARSRRTGVR